MGSEEFDGDAQQAAFDRIMTDVRRTLSGKRVTQTTDDGAVTVTVDGNGDIVRLELARGVVRRLPDTELGTAVRDTVNAARAEAGRRGSRLISRALDADPEFTLFEVVEEALA